jgi:hypothetical protein
MFLQHSQSFIHCFFPASLCRAFFFFIYLLFDSLLRVVPVRAHTILCDAAHFFSPLGIFPASRSSPHFYLSRTHLSDACVECIYAWTGTFNSINTASSCSVCLAGSYGASVGASTCLSCPAGYVHVMVLSRHTQFFHTVIIFNFHPVYAFFSNLSVHFALKEQLPCVVRAHTRPPVSRHAQFVQLVPASRLLIQFITRLLYDDYFVCCVHPVTHRKQMSQHWCYLSIVVSARLVFGDNQSNHVRGLPCRYHVH